jgi:thiamine kinase-like enzyme
MAGSPHCLTQGKEAPDYMSLPDQPLPQSIIEQFQVPGRLLEVRLYGQGYINDTYLGVYQAETGQRKVVFQRINTNVFRRPEEVMENIWRVTQHARSKIEAAGGDPQRETLTLIPTRAGGWWLQAPNGEAWRAYHYIEGARAVETAENLQQVYAAARAFGQFMAQMDDLPGPRLHETIPDFHHTPRRLDTFVNILNADPAGRAAEAHAEIEFLLQRAAEASVVVDLLALGRLPERVTHNDTKLNNVLIDSQTGAGICVIDLDTTMPGSALYDFGDLIRMGAATAAEDERDLSRVHVDMDLFAALARGYLDAAGALLQPAEWDLLAFAGRLITYEQALRFLGDHLNGDQYYKTRYPGQNLDRARTQIHMQKMMERSQAEMEKVIAACR